MYFINLISIGDVPPVSGENALLGGMLFRARWTWYVPVPAVSRWLLRAGYSGIG